MNSSLLPVDWNPKDAGDQVLNGLIKISRPEMKGAHDAEFRIVAGKAYAVYLANDIQPGEAAQWPFVYCALSIIDIASETVEKTIVFAASEKAYENETLPTGACFVPRIIQKDPETLRCFFASEEPEVRQSQMWYVDYDLIKQDFDWNIYPVEIETSQGVFPMCPMHLYQHAVAKGFRATEKLFGLYIIDGFKIFDNQVYSVLNNFPGGQNAWAKLNSAMDRFTVLGDFFLPNTAHFTEAAVNRLPDGTWCAISRQENNDKNYMFSTSHDGIHWSEHIAWESVSNGTCSKPTFNRFGDVYYLGWQENSTVNGVFRSTFNIDVSTDGVTWQRKYHFATDQSFQYPTFHEDQGIIYLTVTQGDNSPSRKERIMFGKLEEMDKGFSD